MADCPHCDKKYPESYLPKHIYEHHSLHALQKRAEAKITPERLQILMQRLKAKYGDAFITTKFP
jgi:hypothetical protein